MPEKPRCTSTAVLKRVPFPTARDWRETSLPSMERVWVNCFVVSSYLSGHCCQPSPSQSTWSPFTQRHPSFGQSFTLDSVLPRFDHSSLAVKERILTSYQEICSLLNGDTFTGFLLCYSYVCGGEGAPLLACCFAQAGTPARNYQRRFQSTTELLYRIRDFSISLP